MRPLSLALFFTIVLSVPLLAQKADITFNHLSIKQGLSQRTVICILQDKQGFMWFGTTDGLNKYDGYKFQVYKNNIKKESSLANNYVNAILEDKDRNLWVGTLEGLDMFDREKDRFIHFNKDSISLHVRNIIQDASGNIWVGTLNEGLCLLDPIHGSFITYKHDENDSNSISHNEVNKIIEYSKDELLVATRRSLDLFNKKTKKFTHIKENRKDTKEIISNRIRTIYKDSKGNIWLSMHRTGIALFNRKDKSFTYYDYTPDKPGITDSYISTFVEGDDGRLLIGTERKGLCIFNYKTGIFTSYKPNSADPTSISDHFVSSLYKDNVGNIWIGTDAEGINMVSKEGNKFMYFTSSPEKKEGLNSKYVRGILEDKEERVWIGTDGGGLNLYNKRKNTFEHFISESSKNSIGSNFIHTLSDLGDGQLLIGFADDKGIDFFDTKTGVFTHYLPETKEDDSTTIAGRIILTSLKDHNGNIWIGSIGTALNFYDAKKRIFSKYRNIKSDTLSISSNCVFAMIEDKAYNVWVGTDRGLNVFNPKTKEFTRYAHNKKNKNSLSNNIIYYLFEDKKGRIWIGTAGGLNLFNKKSKTFITYTEADGLPNSVIKGIQEDRRGNLWLATHKGLTRFNPDTKVCRNYDASDGLQADEFMRQACFTSQKGWMYFGGANGFNIFHPDSIRDNPNIPPVTITDFYIFNKSVQANQPNSPLKKHISETREIILDYDQSVITLEFAALNFINPEKNQYAYLLEGFDMDWNYVGQKRSATYTNLNPGRYTFRVKASNNDNVWNEKGIALEIVITPPFWKTWWFNLIVITLVVSGLISLYRLRINTIERQKKLLEEQVKERTGQILKQKEKIDGLYSEIKDSIRAAETIQKSILPAEELIKNYLPESFIFYKPKDVVSGDFYWFEIKDNKILIAAVDCMGHGVGGAFMSFNAFHLLKEVTNSSEVLVASEILDKLNKSVINELNQKNNSDSKANWGMDIALCIIDMENNNFQYAGANNPLYIIRNKELIQVKADKFAIGHEAACKDKKFINHNIEIKKGDIFYIFSDGYADQLGGSHDGEKFMYSRFRELLLKVADKPTHQQPIILEESLREWMGEEEQLDDILVMGFKV